MVKVEMTAAWKWGTSMKVLNSLKVLIVSASSLFAFSQGSFENICQNDIFKAEKYQSHVQILAGLNGKKLAFFLAKSQNEMDKQYLLEILASNISTRPTCIDLSTPLKNKFKASDILTLIERGDSFQDINAPSVLRSILNQYVSENLLKAQNSELASNYHLYKKSLLWLSKGKEEISRDTFLDSIRDANGDYLNLKTKTRLSVKVYESFLSSKKVYLQSIKKEFYKRKSLLNFLYQDFNRDREVLAILAEFPAYKYYQDDFDYTSIVNKHQNIFNDDIYIENIIEDIDRKVTLFSKNILDDHQGRDQVTSSLQSFSKIIKTHEDKISPLKSNLSSLLSERDAIYARYSSVEGLKNIITSKRVNILMTKAIGPTNLAAHSGLVEISPIYNGEYQSALATITKLNADRERYSVISNEVRKLQGELLSELASSVYTKLSLLGVQAGLGLIDLNSEVKVLLEDFRNTLNQNYRPLSFTLSGLSLMGEAHETVQVAIANIANFLKVAKEFHAKIHVNEMEKLNTYADELAKEKDRTPSGWIDDAWDDIVGTVTCAVTFGNDCGSSNPVDKFKAAFGNAVDAAKKTIDTVKNAASDVAREVGGAVKDIGDVTGINHIVKEATEELEKLGEKVADGIEHNVGELVDEAGDFVTDLQHKPLDTLVDAATTVAFAPVAVPIIIVTNPDDLLTKPGETIEKYKDKTGKAIANTVEDGISDVSAEINRGAKRLENNLEAAWKDAVRLSSEAWEFSGDVVDEAKKITGKGLDIAQDVAKFSLKPLRQLDKKTYDKLMERMDAWTDHAVASIFDMANPTRTMKVDTYRQIYNGHKKAIMETVRDVAKLHTSFANVLTEEVISKINADLARELDKVVELSNDGVDIVDATTSFENVSRSVLLYVGSVVAGPAGSALANVLADRFIDNKNLTEKDLLKSLVIGMTAGYAGEAAAGLGQSGSFLSSSYSNVANSVTRDLSGVVLNGDSYSTEDLAKSIITGVVSGAVSANDLGGGAIGNSSLTAANTYAIENLIDGKPVDLDEAIRASMQAASQASLDGAVEYSLSDLDLPNRLDKELYEAVKEKLAAYGDNERVMTPEMMALSQEEFKEVLAELMTLIEKNQLGVQRDPAFVGVTLALISAGMTVYELYQLSDKAMHDEKLKEFIAYADIHGVKKAMENHDMQDIVSNYHGEILGVAVTALSGPILKGLGKAAKLEVVKKIIARTIVYGKNAMDHNFIKIVTDAALKYKLDTAEKIDQFFDLATDIVKSNNGHLQHVGGIFDSAQKLGLKAKEEILASGEFLKKTIGNDIGAVGDIESILTKNSTLIKGWRKNHIIKDVVDSDIVNSKFIAKNWEAPFKNGTKVIEFSPKSTDNFVRVIGDGSIAEGRWVMKKDAIKGLTPKQIQAKYSLPGTPTHIVDVTVNNSSQMMRGKVARNFGGNEGAVQYLISDETLSNIRYSTPILIEGVIK